MEGPLDSLSVLVDRLTAGLLAGEAGETENLVNLTTTSLPALRAYLEGRSAYRDARYTEAVQQFGRALEFDSTFALAGLGLRSAASWTPAEGEAKPRGLALAWAAATGSVSGTGYPRCCGRAPVSAPSPSVEGLPHGSGW